MEVGTCCFITRTNNTSSTSYVGHFQYEIIYEHDGKFCGYENSTHYMVLKMLNIQYSNSKKVTSTTIIKI